MLSQPNLSRVLHELEEQLGFAIFERTSRGVMPTDRGALFLQYARRILMEMESIEALELYLYRDGAAAFAQDFDADEGRSQTVEKPRRRLMRQSSGGCVRGAKSPPRVQSNRILKLF